MTGTWQDLGIELAWRAVPAGLGEGGSSWPLDREWINQVSIRWPSQYAWPDAHKWLDPLRHGLQRFVRVSPAILPQPFEHVILIELAGAALPRTVAIDYADRSTIDEECAERCALYFKMQYRSQGYPYDHVIPGGFVPASETLYRYLPRVRALAQVRRPRLDVYGRFRLDYATQLRRDAIRHLTDSADLRYVGGGGVVRYSRFLREVADAKICINLPGNGDLCFRLIDYLAVGACVIGPRLRTQLHVPLVDREHIVYTADDLSDLVPLCRRYLQDDAERERMRLATQALFDQFLCRHQLAAYYLYQCQGRLQP